MEQAKVENQKELWLDKQVIAPSLDINQGEREGLILLVLRINQGTYPFCLEKSKVIYIFYFQHVMFRFIWWPGTRARARARTWSWKGWFPELSRYWLVIYFTYIIKLLVVVCFSEMNFLALNAH